MTAFLDLLRRWLQPKPPACPICGDTGEINPTNDVQRCPHGCERGNEMSDANEPLRVVMVTADITSDIEEGLEIEGAPTVILQGGIEAVKAAARLFGESVTVSDAPTYTAADLARAWEAGRDAAADTAFKAICKYPLRTMLTNTDNATMIELSIHALTPPADLAERVKGGAE